MICDRCGRLLNRATGRCVCDDYEGEAPAPVATTHPPPDGPRTMSRAATMALLDPTIRPVRPAPTIAPPSEPAPPPRGPGEARGVLRGVRANRRRVDVVAYETQIVLASRGAPLNLTSGQLAAQDSASRVLDDALVEDVCVREDALSGKATIDLRGGERVVLLWSGRRNRGVSGENLLAHAFSGKVDQGPSELAMRGIRAAALALLAVALLAGVWVGLSTLLAEDPPPPAPPAPPTTLPPAEQAVRAELQEVCGAWTPFAAAVATGDRPDPVSLRPLADSLKPKFDAAAGALADYAPARDEVAYLQDYARKPADQVARESSGRVSYAMNTVSTACSRATSTGGASS